MNRQISEGDSPLAEGASEFHSDPSDFMKLIGGALPKSVLEAAKHRADRGVGNQVDPTQKGHSDADTAVMRDIIAKMQSTAEHNITHTLRDNKPVQRAIITESNKGEDWHIKVIEENGHKSYKIVNYASKKAYFDDLRLFESAKKICKFLDNDHAVNSTSIQKVLYYDDIYANHLNECNNIKRLHSKAKRLDEGARMNILSDKFEASRTKALQAKHQIKKL